MADTKYITIESLENQLGSQMQTLSSVAIKPGANFLSGKKTSPFEKATAVALDTGTTAAAELTGAALTNVENAVSGRVQKVTENVFAQGKIAGETLELAGNLGSLAKLGLNSLDMIDSGEVTDLIAGLTKVTVNTITEKTTEILASSVTTITAKSVTIPIEITKHAMNYFNKHKKSLSQMIKELERDAEKKAEMETTEEEEKTKKQFNEKVKKKIKKIQKGMAEFNDNLSYGISYIASYLENGPEWIADKLDKEVKEKLLYAQSFVDKYTKDATDEIDKFTYNQGVSVGKSMTEKYNTLIMQKAKVDLAKIMELKVKARLKAKALMQKAILSLMSILGKNIPV